MTLLVIRYIRTSHNNAIFRRRSHVWPTIWLCIALVNDQHNSAIAFVLNQLSRNNITVQFGTSSFNPHMVKGGGVEFTPRPIFWLPLRNRWEFVGMPWWLFLYMNCLQNGEKIFILSLSVYPIWRPESWMRDRNFNEKRISLTCMLLCPITSDANVIFLISSWNT